MKFLGFVLIEVLLCAMGAWILAVLLAFAWNVQPVDWDSPSLRFMAWWKAHIH